MHFQWINQFVLGFEAVHIGFSDSIEGSDGVERQQETLLWF